MQTLPPDLLWRGQKAAAVACMPPHPDLGWRGAISRQGQQRRAGPPLLTWDGGGRTRRAGPPFRTWAACQRWINPKPLKIQNP